MRLLMVEDDEGIGEPVTDSLKRAGYAIDWAHDGREAELSLHHDVYDLVLLDLGLPKVDGVKVLTQYRHRGGRAPVIILTARDAIESRVIALDSGADDYLVKPFDLDELAARVRAQLRRRARQANPVFAHDDLTLNPATHQATLKGEPLDLIPREFSLLQALIEEPARVFTRRELEEKLYGWGDEVGSNTIEVHVHGLRRKVGADQVVTVRGVGYRLKRCE
ncbi:response regulator [Caballeronia glebae]|uniref:response regulator n=1 Tax=Caballeronia glebae TaxID=1777143 RepID=UPI0038B9E205